MGRRVMEESVATEAGAPSATPIRRDLRDRVVLVTGGGRGLGEATCRVLAYAGAMVIVADIRADLAAQVAADIGRAEGRAWALAVDVSDDREVERAIAAVRGQHGRLDVLVNNAGIDVTLPFDQLSMEDWDRIIGVNLRGPILMSRAVWPLMKQRRSGHIVNVTSTAAKRTWANAAAYHATKWGLLGFSHALHVEARSVGIKVTAVVAGGMRTPFLLDRFPGLDEGLLQDPRNVAETIRFILEQPDETVVPEVLVLPMLETSWP